MKETKISYLEVRMTHFPLGDTEELWDHNVVPSYEPGGDDCPNMREQHSDISFQHRSWRMDRIIVPSKQKLIWS